MSEKKEKMVYTIESFTGKGGERGGVLAVFYNHLEAEKWVLLHYPDADLVESEDYREYEVGTDGDSIIIQGWIPKKRAE